MHSAVEVMLEKYRCHQRTSIKMHSKRLSRKLPYLDFFGLTFLILRHFMGERL